MNRSIELFKRAWATVAAAVALALAASCGGGGVVGSGGTGSPMGAATGTVNGFGSVIVDGQAFDDRRAPVLSEVEPGRDVASEVKLGHRVSVGYEVAGVASVVRVDAALVGAVTVVASASQFSMLGQTVNVNLSSATGPVTQFGGGYTQAGDLRAGDAVEVHGVLARQGDAYVTQATRVDKLSSAPAYLRVSGLVSQLGTGGATSFSLGALTVDAAAASVLPAGAALANGQSVTVLARPDTLTAPTASAWRLQAAQIRVRELRAGGLDDYVSGSVAHLDTQTKTFTLGGLMVNFAAASVTPAMPLANGQYLRVQGVVGADGALAAVNVTVRDGSSGSEAELKGNISGYDAATRRFAVRGVVVDANGAVVEDCPASGLADGLFVEIHGSLGSNGVVAQSIHCEDESSGSTVEREGIAGAVDVPAMRFSLSPEQGSAVIVTWSATTYFGGVTPQTLAGLKVKVEGSLVGTTLVATKIKLDD
jgi:Domain of unknown function (DUF5666)